MNKRTAIGIIDAQRGFMPESEAEKLWTDGFGELPVPDGHTIVPALNQLLQLPVEVTFTTQDWHPASTAHFADEPNYNTTWPTHCVAQTPGARLHPSIRTKEDTWAFKKGMEELESGEDDTSYSGYNAEIRYKGETMKTLPEWLEEKGVERLVIAGLATDYCVKATAIDFKTKTNMDVVVVTDAIKPVNEETGLQALVQMAGVGIKFITVDKLVAEAMEV